MWSNVHTHRVDTLCAAASHADDDDGNWGGGVGRQRKQLIMEPLM